MSCRRLGDNTRNAGVILVVPTPIRDALMTWNRNYKRPYGPKARKEALVRSFAGGKIQAGVHFQIASGYTGQTTEVLALLGEGDPFERVVGVYIPSYATVSVNYHFRR